MTHPTLPLVTGLLVLTLAADSPAAQAPPADPPGAIAPQKPAPGPTKADRPQAEKPQPEPLPTVEEVKAQVEGGDAAGAMKHLNRLLSLRGKAAEAYDKYELLTLKADAHLRVRAGAAAAAALRQAGEATDDPQKKAISRATEELIRRSKNLAYTPRRGEKDAAKPEPIDLVDPQSRQRALAQMFTDEMAERQPRIEAARANKSGAGVGPVIAAMAALREVEYLELAVNGSNDQISGMVEELRVSGRDMLSKAVERAGKKVDRIAALANDMERVRQVFPTRRGYRAVTVPRRRGIKEEDVPELKKVADGCDEIVAQAQALQEASADGGDELDEVIDAAEDLRLHVQRMLRVHGTEYTKGDAARRRGDD